MRVMITFLSPPSLRCLAHLLLSLPYPTKEEKVAEEEEGEEEEEVMGVMEENGEILRRIQNIYARERERREGREAGRKRR